MSHRSTISRCEFKASGKQSLIHGLALVLMLVFSGCRSVQLSSDPVSQDTIDMTNASSMNRDAIRVIVRVEVVNEADDKRNSFDVVLEKLVKYGATFSSIEPKVGQKLKLSTPLDVTFRKGDVILLDILTPRLDDGQKPLRVRMG